LRLCAKNWLVIPVHSSKPICTLLLTKIFRAARKALLLPSQESKPNLARRRKDQRRQLRPALSRPSPDCPPERSRGIPVRYLKALMAGSLGPSRTGVFARDDRIKK
jgi:hypothetical protein